MDAADALVTSHLLHEAFRIGMTAAAAFVAGWIAERILDTGLRLHGLAVLTGVVGLYLGSAVWALAGWSPGPHIGEFPIVPAVAGAFGVCAVLKLVGLGLAGPRW